MVAGHTRCLVDGCFGFLKRKYRRSDCFSMEQLAQVVNESAAPNVAQCIPGSGVTWRKWDAFFLLHFKKVPKIRSMHHFEFSSADVDGTVKYRRNVEDVWSSTKLLKATTNKEQLIEAELPPVLPPGGISRQRASYLYNDIRQFVPNAFEDTLCPPTPPEPQEE